VTGDNDLIPQKFWCLGWKIEKKKMNIKGKKTERVLGEIERLLKFPPRALIQIYFEGAKFYLKVTGIYTHSHGFLRPKGLKSS